MPAILVELVPYDPVAAAAVTLRATGTDDARICALNGVSWFPVIAEAGSFGLDLFSASFPGFAEAPSGSVTLSLEAFPDAARYVWGDRPAKLWIGEPGDSWPWTLFFEGLVSGVEVRGGRLEVSLRVDDAWLDKPALPTLYAGTGAAEGPAGLKGTPKPLAIGAPRFVQPVLIESVKLIYQVHGYGSVQAITLLFDRLVRYGTSSGNYSDYAALDAATIPAGSWATCHALGLLRFGAPPVGPISCHVEGDNSGADGWARTPGKVIKRLAVLAGAASGQIDATNLAALDSAVNRNLSIARSAQATVRELIGAVAASCNGIAMIDLLGKLRVVRPSLSSPVLTLAADGSAIPQIMDPELLEQGAPFWRVQMEAERAWRVHSSGEFNRLDYADLANPPTDLADINATEGTKLAGIEAGADVTAGAVPTLSVPPSTTFNADFTGVIPSTAFPRSLTARRQRGNTDVSGSTTWTVATGGCTATITDGVVSITAVAASGFVDVISNRDGVELVGRIIVTKVVAAPPSSGGGGGGSASDSSIADVVSASYGTVHAGPMTVTAAAGGVVTLSAALEFDTTQASPAGTFGLYGKWQWRIVGGSWADVASEIAETIGVEVVDEGGGIFVSYFPGAISVAMSKTGLTPATDYEFQLLLRNPTGTRARYVTGTASAVAS
jgi:hypothetical protein